MEQLGFLFHAIRSGVSGIISIERHFSHLLMVQMLMMLLPPRSQAKSTTKLQY